MIEAVALGADGQVFAVTRVKGTSHVVVHASDRARSLYATPDQLRGLWVSPSGAIHAGGKQHHTNQDGAWTTTSTRAARILALWGAGADVFAGTIAGELLRRRDGAWRQLATTGEMIYAIHGTGPGDVHVCGDRVLAHFDGTAVEDRALPRDAYCIQGVHCTAAGEIWLCATSGLYRQRAGEGGFRRVAAVPRADGELYGVGVGASGVFVHDGIAVLRLDGDRLVVERDNADQAFMVKNAAYSTAITSNDRRVVAGGARSVLVNDGDGFVEWPALDVAAGPGPTSKLKPEPGSRPAKPAKPVKPAKRSRGGSKTPRGPAKRKPASHR